MRFLAILFLLLASAACTTTPVDEPDAGPDDASASDVGRDAPPRADAAELWAATPFTPTPATIAYCAGHDDAVIEARITDLLSQMSLEEKLDLLHGASVLLVDGTWLVPGNERLGLPGLHMLDGPRGLSSFTRRHGTAFPVGILRGASWDPALERRVGAAMGVEHRSAGADVILAPTINVLRHPRWGRAQETYGEDTHHLGEMGLAFVEGVQSEHVLASVKHFAGNSIENNRHRVDVRMDERTLREVYLPHFRRVIVDGHAGTVMSAYNSLNGHFCDVNAHLLGDILRGEWGFSGVVESDWVFGTHGATEALAAGLSIEMPTESHFRPLAGEYRDGVLTRELLDTRVREVLRTQLCFDLDTVPRTPGVVIDDPSQRETPEHLALAREVARRGIVLLRNEASALPFDAGVHSIVVVGRNADEENIGDDGSSDVLPTSVVTALEGIRARAGATATVTHLPGAVLDTSALATVSAADVVVVVTGLQRTDEGEAEISAGDRASLDLPAEEVALIHAVAAANDRVVVVLEAGAALITRPWDAEIEALLFAGYPGSEGGNAVADVLFGDAAPSGRLPFSMPVLESDLPTFDDVSDTVDYGYFHGYRHLAHEGTTPAYPFGFGLSYTTFALSAPRVSATEVHAGETVDVTVTVTNEGDVRAIETVELFASAVGSSVERAPEDLRAFAQIELDPHASGDVTLEVRADDLRIWDVGTSAWVLEPIDYALHVGEHAGDPGALTVTIHGAP